MPDSTPIPPDPKTQAIDGPSGSGLGAAYLRNRDDPAGAMERARQWAQQNTAAIQAYNAFVEENGVVGDDLRSW